MDYNEFNIDQGFENNSTRNQNGVQRLDEKISGNKSLYFDFALSDSIC